MSLCLGINHRFLSVFPENGRHTQVVSSRCVTEGSLKNAPGPSPLTVPRLVNGAQRADGQQLPLGTGSSCPTGCRPPTSAPPASHGPFVPRAPPGAHSSVHTRPGKTCHSPRNVRFQVLHSFPDSIPAATFPGPPPPGGARPAPRKCGEPGDTETRCGGQGWEGGRQERRLPFRGHPEPRPLTSASQVVTASQNFGPEARPGRARSRDDQSGLGAGGLRRDRPREAR